jgi:hypothetical protein
MLHWTEIRISVSAKITILTVDNITTGAQVLKQLIPYFCLSPFSQNRDLNFFTQLSGSG